MGKLGRLVVMVSGSGSNLQAILDAIAAGRLDAEVVRVVSNKADAFALERASRADVPTLVFSRAPYKAAGQSRERYDADLAEQVAADKPDLVVLAGWMHVFSAAFLDRFPSGVINLHPALPGSFTGAHAIKEAFDAFQAGLITYSGCMVHYATPDVDAGPVLAEARVPFQPGDTLDSFSTRIHEAEHELLVLAIRRALIAKQASPEAETPV